MSTEMSPVFTRSVRWGTREIPYTLRVMPQERLTITVHPDLHVEVVAPEGHTMEAIEQRVSARRAWIARRLQEFERYLPLPTPRLGVSGETYWYLGRQYRLRVHEGVPEVWRAGGRLNVRVPSPEQLDAVRRAVRTWYAERARAIFRERLEQVRASHPRLGRLKPQLRVQSMARRWGSCSARGMISLNVELVRAPVSCIDYVIVHELCHLIEPRHSPRFYRQLSAFMPDWRRRRATLEQPLR